VDKLDHRDKKKNCTIQKQSIHVKRMLSEKGQPGCKNYILVHWNN